MRVSIIGGSSASTAQQSVAETVGYELASRDHTIVCGGLTGVMRAVCRGAKRADGLTIGILPGSKRSAANEYVDIPIVTGLGDARNVLVARNGDAVIAIDGAYGTLSEIALALNADIPVVGLDTHDVPGVVAVETPVAAIEEIEAASG